MNDDELRALIRAAIQKNLGSQQPASAFAPAPNAPQELRRDGPLVPISFGQYRLERAAGETECLIEPSVQCNHCGFCKCHGH
jgi:hypothetical protein